MQIVHLLKHTPKGLASECGSARYVYWTNDRQRVTCKRCLAALMRPPKTVSTQINGSE